MFTRQAKQRRSAIEARLGEGHRILEFGPLDNPTFHRDLGHDVSSLDYFSYEELTASLVNNPRRKVERVGPVDHVVKTKNFADEIDAKFDLIVANHVLEHVPDPIAWFANAEALLEDDGWIFLALPDRRYTFDYYRPETVAPSLMRAHVEDLEIPSKWQVLEAIYYHTKVDVAALWDGEPAPPLAPRWGLDQAFEVAEERSKTYAGIHCWVFTMESFERCVIDLQSAGLLPFRLDHIVGPFERTNEFHVYLQKSEGPN